MLKELLVVFLVAAICVTQGKEEENKKVSYTFSHEEFGAYVLLFGNMIMMATVRYLTRAYEIDISYSVVAILLGVVIGVVALYCEWMASLDAIGMKMLRREITVYLPALVFGVAFCIDVHAFFKSLPQILVISIPVSFCSAAITGCLMRLVIDTEWDVVDGFAFGALFLAIYPIEIIQRIRETNSQTKHVTILFEGETLLGVVFLLYMYLLVHCFMKEWVVHWYQFVMALVRLLFFGFPAGYCCGLLGCCLLRANYNNCANVAMVTVVTCYTSYWFCTSAASTGHLAVMVTGVMMSVERTSLPVDVEKFITDLWKVIMLVMNSTVFLITGMIAPQILAQHMSLKAYFLVFVTYILAFIARFLSFLLFSPILSRIGYGMSFTNMIVCVWGGLKNPVSLSLAAVMTQIYEDHKASIFFLHSVGVYILALLINGTFFRVLLNLLKLSNLSMARQVNMNNCMKYILQARGRTIAILKMDRFLSDANWPLVTSATTLKHPYKKKFSLDTDDENEEKEEDYFMGYRFTVCPDCKKNILNEPTKKEMKEMIKEAKMRVLKLRKVFYSRRYENGFLTKEGVRIAHQSVEVALDSEDKQIEIDGLLRLFNKESVLFQFIRNRIMILLHFREVDTKPPKKRMRLICSRIVQHMAFLIFSQFMVLVNVAVVIYHLVTKPPIGGVDYHVLFGCNVAIFIIFLIRFWVQICGYSRIYICQHGFRKYFQVIANLIDFIAMCALCLDLLLNAFAMHFIKFGRSDYYDCLWYILEALRLIQAICFFQLLGFCKGVYPSIIKYLDARIDKYRITAYELGNNYISGEEEILENINAIVDNDKIRDILRSKIDEDRLEVAKVYAICQKDRPWVAITVKTKLVMQAVLSCIRDDINELKTTGWVDDVENLKLQKSLLQRYRQVAAIKSVQPSLPKDIFRAVPWMGHKENVIKFLYENVATKKFDPGDVICREGEVTEGVYILITGLFKLNYAVRKEVISKLNESGILPVADYLSPSKFEENSLEYIIPGNTIGELAVITERPYNCMITAERYSQVFVLSRDVIKQAMEMDSDPINGLECRLWKAVSFRIVVPILMNATAYHSLTLQNLWFTVERSFVPNISSVKVFVVNEMMDDIVLIEGVMVDFNTRDIYTGPCYIPRSVQKLMLPKCSALNIGAEAETKLLIVPAKDFDEYDIMVNEEQICEMVSDSASKCLKHFVQNRLSKQELRQRRKSMAYRPKQRVSSLTTRSKITFANAEAKSTGTDENKNK